MSTERIMSSHVTSTGTDDVPLNSRFNHKTSNQSYTIHWTSIGAPSCQPIIFVHGTPWSSRVWTPFALSLARNFHVYVFDNPGFGDSPLGEPVPGQEAQITPAAALDANLAEQSAVFAALFKSWESDEKEGWEGRKPQVVAHDHGGLMSLRAHLLHDCEYASLCLIDVVALGPFGQPLFKLVAANEDVFKQLTGSLFEGMLDAYIRDAAHKELSRETVEMLKAPWLRDQKGREAFIRQMCQANSRSTEEVESSYATVGKSMPVMIIWGKEDKWIPVSTADRLAKALGAREVAIIKDAGHLIMYDQGARLGVELGCWLRGHGSGR